MKRKIKFGIGIPTGEEGLMYPIPFASANDNIVLAQKAEKMGYDSVWGNDHVLTQEYVKKEFGCAPRYYSPLVTLAAIAQATTKIKLSTALLVVPFRHPVMIAKEVATLDNLSNGRVQLGVGIGAYIEEFKNMFGPRVDGYKRGEMLDEGLKALRMLWEGKPCSFKGKYFEFNNVESFPTPVQKPLPIYVGGNSEQGRKRTAEFGNGWLPAAMTSNQIRDGLKEIQNYASEIGRDISDLDVAPQFQVYVGKTDEEAWSKFKETQHYKHDESLKNSTLKNQQYDYRELLLIGSKEHVKNRIGDYIDAGVTTFAAMIFSTNTIDEMVDMMQLFAEDIMPEFTK